MPFEGDGKGESILVADSFSDSRHFIAGRGQGTGGALQAEPSELPHGAAPGRAVTLQTQRFHAHAHAPGQVNEAPGPRGIGFERRPEMLQPVRGLRFAGEAQAA